MRSPTRRMALLTLATLVIGGCHGSCAGTSAGPVGSDAAPSSGSSVSALAATDAAFDAFAPLPRDAASEAPHVFTQEDRRAYAAAMKGARAAQAARELDLAIRDFTHALDILPDDSRALAERGYAQYASHSLDLARNDLELARAGCPGRDEKLAAQIEYNLGLVYAALAAAGDDQQLATAVGHFRQSNDLVPSRAAAAKMGGCPVSWGVPDVHTYTSLDEAERALADAGTGGDFHPDVSTPEVLLRDQPSDAVATDVLLPIDHGAYAHVVIGSMQSWHCGYLGEATFAHQGDIWTIEYQRHYGEMSPGVCSCDDGELCTTEWSANKDDKPCACADPMCPMSCALGETPQGLHQVTLVDARDGRGLWRWQIDHAFVDAVKIETDPATKHFRASGLTCDVDVDMQPHAK